MHSISLNIISYYFQQHKFNRTCIFRVLVFSLNEQLCKRTVRCNSYSWKGEKQLDMKVSLTPRRALMWGPPSCLIIWGHGDKFFLQRGTLERTLQPMLCATHPVNHCGDSQVFHLLDEAPGRKAGRENYPQHI